jgi:ketosteroid isomerase-like protein
MSGPVRAFLLAALAALGTACAQPAADAVDLALVEAEIEALVWTFHAADTAMDAEAVVGLLWPDYEMLVDGQRLSFDDVAAGSRDFMASLEFFHTTWSDLEIIPLSPDFAVASFTFRDSIMTSGGDLVQSRGPTTLLWERRNGEWRMRFGDADHYPISP